jgi:uncharacterized protein YndB with AHSA1/START domain
MKNSKHKPIITQETFSVSVSRLWQAITQLDEMKQWYFDNIPDFLPKVGFKTNFLVTVADRNFPHYWEIIEVLPQEKIVYDWTFKGYPGKSRVSFEIFKENNKSILRVTATIIEPFPSDIPEFKRESGVQGWNYLIKERLKNYLKK